MSIVFSEDAVWFLETKGFSKKDVIVLESVFRGWSKKDILGAFGVSSQSVDLLHRRFVEFCKKDATGIIDEEKVLFDKKVEAVASIFKQDVHKFNDHVRCFV